MIEKGRVCLKTAGREAGRYCIVLEKINDNFALVTGPKTITGIRRRKCNISHLEPLEFVLPIPDNADDKTVEEIIKTSEHGLIFQKTKPKTPLQGIQKHQ